MHYDASMSTVPALVPGSFKGFDLEIRKDHSFIFLRGLKGVWQLKSGYLELTPSKKDRAAFEMFGDRSDPAKNHGPKRFRFDGKHLYWDWGDAQLVMSL